MFTAPGLNAQTGEPMSERAGSLGPSSVPTTAVAGSSSDAQTMARPRDEAEAERKAKSKRERATRRSTQGITAGQLQAATELSANIKKSSITSDDGAQIMRSLEAATNDDIDFKITPIAVDFVYVCMVLCQS
jgi:hypothetical protein